MAGKPTIIVPFFGDQSFWGLCVSHTSCGPEPIPVKMLTVDNLIRAIEFCKNPDITENAQKMGKKFINLLIN